MSGAPFKKLPASPSVGSTSVPVADRGGEEVNIGFSDLRTGGGNQLRDPRARRRAGNDRKFDALGPAVFWVSLAHFGARIAGIAFGKHG
jgi:hypothetical protein